MEIPITQLTNVVTIFVLVFVTLRIWKRSFERKTIPLFLFASAFSAILLMMIMFALPFIVIRHPGILQIVFSIADFAFMTAVALFAAVTISIIFPTNRTLLVFLPGIIGLTGFFIFLWQIFNPIVPNLPVSFFTWQGITLINYQDGSPIFLKVAQGTIALCIFLLGSFLFFRQARSMEGAVHARAFLFGAGYAMAVAAVIANYIVGAFPTFQSASFFVASLIMLVSVLCMYKGICLKMPDMLDKEIQNKLGKKTEAQGLSIQTGHTHRPESGRR